MKTNLQAGRIRLVFLADSIPTELRRVVEFLNEQMDPAEVIAIEVKQFVGTGVKTLVPRVLGQSETARQKKSSGSSRGSKQWDETSFFETLLERRGQAEHDVARQCLNWAQAHKLRIWWGRGKNDGSLFPVYDSDVGKNFVFSLWTNGKVELQFQYMSAPPFADLSMRQELARRLNEIPGVTVPDEALSRRPTFELGLLVAPDSLAKFFATCDWALSEVLKSETARLQANSETSP